jgi:hypothetical protein
MWGKGAAADDLGDKLRAGATSLFVLPFRPFGTRTILCRAMEPASSVSRFRVGTRRSSRALPVLSLDCCGCAGPAQAEAFAAKLATNTTLREFHASGKAVGLVGAAAFGAWGVAWVGLCLVWCLCCTRMCDCPPHLHTLASPGNALRRNTTLTSLCIGNEEFGDEALAALCDGLVENRGRGACLLRSQHHSIALSKGACMPSPRLGRKWNKEWCPMATGWRAIAVPAFALPQLCVLTVLG